MTATTTRFVDANRLRFEVLEAGHGDRLALCLHGFPEHAVSWSHQTDTLVALGYRVWAVNQRGYGLTTRPPDIADYKMSNLVADVAALIDASGASEVVLIGHDWGAMVAWTFAALRVRPLSRLVIMNVPHPLCFQAALRHWRQLRKSWYVAFFQLPRLPERALSANHGQSIRRMFRGIPIDPDTIDILARQIATPGAATAMLNWYRALRLRTPADLSRPIDTPTLVIWGENDIALDPICLDGTDRYVTNLRIERLPGISHWVQQHAPTQVNALLLDFLGQ
jgi:pimeloyl-ACP methyl ester carboxylesterase